MANPRRVYYLFDHRIKIKPRGAQQSVSVEVPVLSRALESTGLALGLQLATPEQLQKVVEGVTYFKRGSVAADRVLVVYTERQNNEDKVRTISLPIPAFAPNYKILPVIRAANSGRGALSGRIIGFYRHGFLIPLGNQGQGGSSG
jgi:hypothetical protein